MSTTNDWTEWNGGTNPAPGKRVIVKYRAGGSDGPIDSSDLVWSHLMGDANIIGYKIIDDTPKLAPLTQDEPMTKRERIAALMMAAYVGDSMPDHQAVSYAIDSADALIAELKRRKEPSHE